MRAVPPRASSINKFAEDILGCWELVTLTLGESGRRPQIGRRKNPFNATQGDKSEATLGADITSRPGKGNRPRAIPAFEVYEENQRSRRHIGQAQKWPSSFGNR